jgi:hypothetical protein
MDTDGRTYLGESFDYIGSSRLVYDMTTDSFPYNLTAVTQGAISIHPLPRLSSFNLF